MQASNMYGSMSDVGHGSSHDAKQASYTGLASNGPPPPVLDSFRPHNRLASDSSFQSTTSRTSTLDEQKMAYLKALAAREAYQQRRQGGEAAPLTALEEKERLRKQYEEEEKAGNISSNSEMYHAGNASATSLKAQSHGREGSGQQPFKPSTGPLYSPGSVYLTPGTSLAQGPNTNASVEYFDQNGDGHNSNSSSSHHGNHHASAGASEQSHVSGGSSVVSPSWHRNPAIAKGKQRRYSSYVDDEEEDTAGGSAAPPPPMRPPKPKAVLQDEYSYLDTPVSPGAAEYQRQFFFRQSMSNTSHSGH